VGITRPIRHGLVTVAVLGVFTAALSAAALYRVITLSMVQRLERAREAIVDELQPFIDATRGTREASDGGVAPPALIGMRGGSADSVEDMTAHVPAGWRAVMASGAARARETGAAAAVEAPITGATLVGRIVPATGGRLAWAAIAVKPSAYNQSWRLLVLALTVSALLLVASAAYALFTVKRGAGALQASLKALAHDLSAPVPRPPVLELEEIADGIATLARHLAESRQIQEKLGQDLARQERLVALGRVVAGVAHEVRNPLASIKLRLDLATADGAPLPPAARRAIEHASSEIARLDRLVADLLIVSGRALGPRQPLQLTALLAARAEAMAPWSAQRGVTIQTGGRAPEVAVDADAVGRALDNLLRNAVEASPQGATVTATVDSDPAQVSVRVIDRGTGVPDGRAGELFEPFFTTKGEGTGLGLAISRAIARAHGGDIAYARDGAMTRFELTLPLQAPAA